MTKTCKELKERMPRNKYRDIDRARLAYAKQRKHTKTATDKLLRRLLNLLSKQIGQWNRICEIHTVDISLNAEQSISARNSRSETLLLFFGIHMANAAILAARQLAIEEKEKRRKKRRA